MRGGPCSALALAIWAATAVPARAAEADVCGQCHPQEVAGYLETGMGRSIGVRAEQPPGALEHALSGSSFAVERSEAGMIQRIERDGFAAAYPVEFVIGSGNAAFGYLIRVGRAVYQSPLAYYAKRARWDMAPGFEEHPAPDFDRPVLPECLWCHADRPPVVPLSLNSYAGSDLRLESISCGRCHGDGAAHLANPSADTIVNPAKLPSDKRDSVCEQCHLSGELRVLNPGKTFGDFQPGMRLEEVLSVYTGDREGAAPGRFKVVSHFEQLQLSACYGQSDGILWCGTCHDPHERPADPDSYYRDRCLHCHAGTLPVEHVEPAADCVSCHMARRQSHDSGHSAFTDHLIAVRPSAQADSQRPVQRIRAWRNSANAELAQRNLGMAYIDLGRRRERTDFLDEGASLLARLAQAGSLDSAGLAELGGVLIAKEAPPEAGFKPLAVQLLRDALQLAPTHPARHRALAAALWDTGDREQSIELLERAIWLDPQVKAAYQVLARIYRESGDPDSAAATWRRYLDQVPQSLAARRELRLLQRPLGIDDL